jgi:hypothetical protein
MASSTRTLHVEESVIVTRRRGLFVVASVWLALGTAEAAPSVGVDLSRLDCEAACDAAALEQALVIRLLQEGFAINPLTGDPAIVVAIAGRDHELVLSAKSGTRAIAHDHINGSSGAQLHLSPQRAVELARPAREAIPRSPPAPPPVPAARVAVAHGRCSRRGPRCSRRGHRRGLEPRSRRRCTRATSARD